VYTATTVRDLAFDPGGATVLAATDAGLFRSTQGGVGTTWALIDVDGVGHSLQDCWSIAYAGPQTWVLTSVDAVSPNPGRIWQSTDGGLHWSEKTSGLGASASDVGRITVTASAQAAGQPWRVYALASNQAQKDQRDVFRSNDGGATWSSLAMNGCGTNPCAGQRPLNVTDNQPDLNFIHDQASYNQMLVADPANPDIVFIGGNLSTGRTTDGGANWSVMTDWLPFSLATNTGGLDTNPATLAQYAHADWHTGTVAHVGGVDSFYGGNDGGLIRASSNVLTGAPPSVTWEDKLNRGIISHLIYSVASGKERPATSCAAGGGDIVWGGLQDNGSRLRNLSGKSAYVGYNQIAGGDGFGVGLGCTAAGMAMGSQLLSTYVDQISLSTNGGQSFSKVIDRTTGLSPPVAMDPGYNFKMKVVADLSADFTYLTPIVESASVSHVYRSTQNGALNTWNRINGAVHTEALSTLASWPKPVRGVTAHPRVTNHYAAVAGGRVYLTTDGGANWYESARAVSTNGTNYLSLFSVAFDPNDTTGNTVWAASPATALYDPATLASSSIPAGKGHLFKCAFTTATAGATCTPVSSGIPAAVPIRVVKVDPGDSNSIYAGTEIGLYRSTNGGANFSRYGTGLPLVEVTDIAINADDSAIRVSTFGRGFWEIYPSTTAPAGVAGTGDLDFSGVIDGFDLVGEAAIEFSDRTTPDFNPVGDVAFNNVIDEADLAALIAKLGGLP